jgi:cyclic pyranopterin phosphate synthase
MKDKFNRPLKNIRISLTERCNLKCYYCHNEGQAGGNGTAEMTPEEVEQILLIAHEQGIKRVKFTGGEPLLRNDIVEIVQRAAAFMEDVSMTTNGTFPEAVPHALREAGLTRVNISLDSFDSEQYRVITGRDMNGKVQRFIKASIDAGLFPVKINIVAQETAELEELMATVGKVWELGGIPQVIELVGHVPSGDNGGNPFDRVEAAFAARAVKIRERAMHRRKIYSVENGTGELHDVEIVRPMHNTQFCSNCTRMRVTSSGHLKPCLMHNEGLVDILTPLREGADINELTKLFKLAVDNRFPYWRN